MGNPDGRGGTHDVVKVGGITMQSLSLLGASRINCRPHVKTCQCNAISTPTMKPRGVLTVRQWRRIRTHAPYVELNFRTAATDTPGHGTLWCMTSTSLGSPLGDGLPTAYADLVARVDACSAARQELHRLDWEARRRDAEVRNLQKV